ncbi:MAG: FapA family protein [Desulfobacula sp.]|uniref:FapA family protein n=1 Tax=Desulfobacula sp. TaxID=2593537 RepID=UPI0025C37881|nr:FapA family protein [Desulfobacula sp.]MCD4722988.1 FapA family protein [Desulfobacula sp.]
MEQSYQSLSLPALALQYGTITNEQYSHINRLYSLKLKEGQPLDFDRLLLSQKFATQYQIGLLKLIREYLIIKKQGEEFGKIAIEKGLATQEDVDKALEHQKNEFKRAKIRKLIGNILVESRVITIKQKNMILKEQTFLDTQAEKIFTSYQPNQIDLHNGQQIDKQVNLSGYEKQFLQIKVLDQEFAASVIEKNLASKREVKIAQKVQEEKFEEKKQIRILGDIMVELNYLTEKQKNLILREQERIEENNEIVTDSIIQVRISQDQMEALIKIKKDIKHTSLQDIKQALETRGIRYGIYPDAILQCNLDMGNDEFIAAKQDFSLELIKTRKAFYHFDTSKIDTEVKKKGATLAEQRIGGDTYLKKDLFGNNIEQTKGHDVTFRCASGTRLSKDNTKAFAGKTGFPSLSIDRKLYVHPTINVLEDADLKYGPLEMYANLNISGVLTGAYPVNAGEINAREIRGAHIEAIGSVRSQIGITDSVISAQGDIHARYLHHCRIETFGNVYIENEIIDSQVFCSGKIDSDQCRIISSTLYGKKGIELAGVGNNKTKGCILGAGTEHHILEKAKQINIEIKNISRQLDGLTEKRAEQDRFAKKSFQKMIELKIFHDRAKDKKKKLSNEFKKRTESFKKEKLKNIVKLIGNLETRMESSLASLKELNELKKKYEKENVVLEKRIKRLEPKIKRKILELQMNLFAFFEWTRKQENISQIKIHGKVFQRTLLKGIFSSLKIETNLNKLSVFEKQKSKTEYKMVVQKN